MQYGMMCRVKFKKKKNPTHFRDLTVEFTTLALWV